MVGPIPDEERQAFQARLKVAFVLLVAVSGGLITLQGDVGVLGFALATLGGALVGVALTWLVFPSGLPDFG